MSTPLRIALLTMLLALVSLPASAAPESTPRAEAPRLVMESLSGKRIYLNRMKGKVVAVAFWATWCVPCKKELKVLGKLRKNYGARGFEVLAVNADGPETFSDVRAFAKRHRMKMPIITDRAGKVAAGLNPRSATPYTVLIDREGRVAWTHEGFSKGDGEGLAKRIEALLGPAAP